MTGLNSLFINSNTLSGFYRDEERVRRQKNNSAVQKYRNEMQDMRNGKLTLASS